MSYLKARFLNRRRVQGYYFGINPLPAISCLLKLVFSVVAAIKLKWEDTSGQWKNRKDFRFVKDGGAFWWLQRLSVILVRCILLLPLPPSPFLRRSVSAFCSPKNPQKFSCTSNTIHLLLQMRFCVLVQIMDVVKYIRLLLLSSGNLAWQIEKQKWRK